MNTLIFDLDGVLLDYCEVHYTTLNTAIEQVAGEKYVINRSDHETLYNGRSTRTKLDMLVKNGMSDLFVEEIYKRKQALTIEATKQLVPNKDLQTMLSELKASGKKLICASNCIRSTIDTALTALGILDYFTVTLSNEDITSPKPDPEIYLTAMRKVGSLPSETLIFEDSWVGITSGLKSGAFVQRVENVNQLTLDFVVDSINYCKTGRNHLTKNLNVVIPMAGNGSRFANAGYIDPKPLIPVFGRPMISWVVENIGVDAQYIFIIRKDFEHAKDFLNALVPGCKIITVDTVTDGAARTVLLTRDLIDNNNPLIIANSDQYVEFSALDFICSFLYNPEEAVFSAKISTFDGLGNPKWSYAAVKDGYVTDVKEKDPISDYATTGIYLWRHGSDFVRFADQMISKNIRVNNEFYVAPVFTEALESGLHICISNCDKMWGLGVPEDLEYFLASFRASDE